MTENQRHIYKSRLSSPDDAYDALQMIFVAELVSPSDEFWIVSPWITDIGLIDNRTLAFAGLDASWPSRVIRLSELLVQLARWGSRVRVITRPDSHNTPILDRLRDATEFGSGGNGIVTKTLPKLHEKGILSRDHYLSGSMNITFSGVHLNDEHLLLSMDDHSIAEALVVFRQRYEP